MKNAEKILTDVSILLAEGYEDEFEKFIESIQAEKDKRSLPKLLQEKLDKIKNTPIDEPEIFEVLKGIEKEELSIIDLVLRFLTEEELDEFSIEDVASFAGMVNRKITARKDEKGIFKQTPNTAGWQRPKPSHIKKYEELTKAIKKAMVNKEVDKIPELSEKLTSFLYEASKVEEDKLTDWEKQLVVEQTTEAIKGYLNSFLGKR